MRRALAASLFLACSSTPALAKYTCPPGTFIIQAVANAPEPLRSGLTLELGAGEAALPGVCAPNSGRRYDDGNRIWINRVRVRWPECTPRRRMSLRANFFSDALYCTRLTGTLRLGRRRFAVVADRVPSCGNGLREPGEQCDGYDGVAFLGCCSTDCRANPGCAVQCDRDHFPCVAEDVCFYECGARGVCRPRAEVDCGNGPVCACDRRTTYRDRCAAYDDGKGVAFAGSCPSAEPPPRY